MKTKEENMWTQMVRVLLAAGCMLVLSSPASAEGGYLGASVGAMKLNEFCSALSSDLASLGLTTVGCDEKDTGLKLYGGFQFSPSGAIEFGYADFGKGSITGMSGLGTVTATWEGTGFFASLVGKLPVGEAMGLLGRVGLHNWDADIKASGPGGSISDSDSGTDLTYGFGASLALGKAVAMRVEWERFEFDEEDGDLVSLGVTFNLQ